MAKILKKLISGIIFTLLIINTIPVTSSYSEILSSSEKSEIELNQIVKTYGEENIIFENGLVLNINESVDLSQRFEDITIDEIISNNNDILKVDGTTITGVNEGVTFLTIKEQEKYHVLQVYVEEYNAGIMSINNLEEGSERLRSQYVVFVDAGHGGSDPGAVANGVKEKDINLSVALKVRSKLQDLGVQVVMNRDKDIFVNYKDTAVLANNANPDVFVSIHHNSAGTNTGVNGIESFYNKDIDKVYANGIHNKLISYTGAYNRGLKWDEYYVTRHTKMPAVLIEGGFVTNAAEAAKLKTDGYQEKIANAIVDGAMDYLKNNVELSGISGKRIYGQTRYETSYKIFEDSWKTSENAILVSGLDYPDSLCATPLAAKYDAPILLVKNTSLENQQELKRILIEKKVKNVIIIGGSGVVPLSIEKELDKLNITNRRLGGATRFETSAIIANEIGVSNGEVVVTSSRGFADGISISSIAAISGMPILLSDSNNLSNKIKSFYDNNNITKTYVIGGEGVLSNNLMNKLINPERIGGIDRYATNKAIFDRFKNKINLETVYLASAVAFPDALSSSAAAVKTNSFVLLSANNELKQNAENIIRNNASKIKNINVLSSNKVITDSVISKLGIVIK